MLALGGTGVSPAYACRLFPPNSTDYFRARQNERETGFQSISFRHDESDFVVSTQQSFRYLNNSGNSVEYSHRAREVWVNGWLNRFESSTRHGEHNSSVFAETVDDVTMLVRSTESRVPTLVTGYVVPGTLWHRDARLVGRLMDLVDGRLKLVRVYYVGKKLIPVGESATPAHHYLIRGEMNLDAWYTEDCQLARIVLPLRNAAPITFGLS